MVCEIYSGKTFVYTMLFFLLFERLDIRDQLLHSQTTMTDLVLYLQRHLGKADSKTVGHKDRVIAKTVRTITLGEDDTINTSFKIARLPALDETYHRAEIRPTVGLSIHSGKQLIDIVIKRAMLTSITGTIDTRSTIQRLHLKTRVVGKAILMSTLPYPLGFLQGISLQGISRFGYISLKTHVGKTLYLHDTIQQLADLTQFMFVICGKNQSFHILQRYTKKLNNKLLFQYTIRIIKIRYPK